MGRATGVFGLVVALGFVLPATAQQVQLGRQAERPVTQLIVRYKDDNLRSFGASEGQRKSATLANKTGVALSYKRQMSGMAHVLSLAKPTSRSEALALAKRLEMDVNVLYAEVDEWLEPSVVPSDPGYATQWHYHAPDVALDKMGGINAPAAWDVARGQGVIVAVIDTGIATHLDLSMNVINGYDFVTDTRSANDGDGRDADASDPGNWRSATDCLPPNDNQVDSNWHGTLVAGTIAALANNNMGVVGVAYESRVLAVRALGRCGGFTSDVSDAIRWAAGLPVAGVPNNTNIAKVINLSLGSPVAGACLNSQAQAISDARTAGSTIVVATANKSDMEIYAPSNCPGVIAVTAHTYQGDNASYANVGPGTTISAPGGGACKTPDGAGFTCATGVATKSTNLNYWVWSTTLYGLTTPTSASASGSVGSTYGGSVGTSMAAPHVSGVAALLLSRMPTVTPDEITFLITSSARPHPAGLFCAQASPGICGSGLLDAAGAIARLSDRTPMLTVVPSATLIAGGQTATLTANATPRNGGSAAFTYTWTQTAGPTTTLTDNTTSSPSFIGTNPGGTHTFSVVLRDANGYRVTQTVSVRSNNAPTLTPVGAVSVVTGSTAAISVTATDPENDVLTYVATNLPSGATFSAATGQFTWPNVSAALGSYTFNVVANDGVTNSAALTVTVNVTDPPPPAPPPVKKKKKKFLGAISEAQILGLLAFLAGTMYLRRRRATKQL
jgi:serine protease